MLNDAGWIAAIMRSTGVKEIRVSDDQLENPPEGSLLSYRDVNQRVTVIRLVEPGDAEWRLQHEAGHQEVSLVGFEADR